MNEASRSEIFQDSRQQSQKNIILENREGFIVEEQDKDKEKNMYATEEDIQLQSPDGTKTTTVHFGFSFSCLLFSFLVPLFRKDFSQAILFFILFLFCLIIGIWTGFYIFLVMLIVVYAMRYNDWYLKKKIGQGWVPIDQTSETALQEKGYVEKEIFDEKFFHSVTHGDNEKIVKLNYGRSLFSFLFCVAVMALFIWFPQQPMPKDAIVVLDRVLRLIAPGFVVLAGFCALVFLVRMLRFKPALVINNKGISTYITPLTYATISWKDIQNLSLYSDGGHVIFGVSLNSFEDFKARQSFLSKIFLKLNSGRPPQIKIPELNLDESVENIFYFDDESSEQSD